MKDELITRLKAEGVWTTADRSSKAWKDAFAKYNSEVGDRLDMGCNKCFAKVKEWLEKP